MNETGVQDLLLLAVVTAMVQDGVIIVGGLIVVIVQRGLILFGWVRLGGFGFGSLPVAGVRDLSEKENLKFESAVILKFDRN